jgi:hypothetical protein
MSARALASREIKQAAAASEEARARLSNLAHLAAADPMHVLADIAKLSQSYRDAAIAIHAAQTVLDAAGASAAGPH